MALRYLEGLLMGKLAAHWSYAYLPLAPRLDYQMRFLAFKQYANVSEQTRLRVNRLYAYLKSEQSRTGNIPSHNDLDVGELSVHHVVSDLQADVQWKNFESHFDAFFQRDALACNRIVSFAKGTRIFSHAKLEELYQKSHQS